MNFLRAAEVGLALAFLFVSSSSYAYQQCEPGSKIFIFSEVITNRESLDIIFKELPINYQYSIDCKFTTEGLSKGDTSAIKITWPNDDIGKIDFRKIQYDGKYTADILSGKNIAIVNIKTRYSLLAMKHVVKLRESNSDFDYDMQVENDSPNNITATCIAVKE